MMAGAAWGVGILMGWILPASVSLHIYGMSVFAAQVLVAAGAYVLLTYRELGEV